MGDDLGQVGGGGVGVGGGGEGKEAEGLLLKGGLGVRGGVVKAVEEHGEGVGGEGGDDGVEVIEGDLVRVAVRELGEGGEDALFQLHHGQVGGERRRWRWF